MSSNQNFEFSCPVQIVFEVGGSAKIGQRLTQMGAKNVFVATDKFLLDANKLAPIFASLDQEGLKYCIFSDFEPNPTIEMVQKGSSLFKAQQCDYFLGIGGGSSIDIAKAIAILATNPGPLQEYEGPEKVPHPVPPIMAVPTTAGTGSEVNGSTVVTDKVRKYKFSIRSSYLNPTVALLDPTLLCSVPPAVIAATGMDALIHAMESFVSTAASPITEGLALTAIRLAAENIRAFYANANNMEAAGNMLVASTVACMSFANARLGCIHALAHALGGFYNIPHGLTCAVLLPGAMDYNLIANPEKFARIAAAMGENIEGMNVLAAARKAVSVTRELINDLDLPAHLSQLGVKAEDGPLIVQNALKTGIHLTSPRSIDQTGLETILKNAL